MTCAECKHGTITMHSSMDKCSHPSNVLGFHPYAVRHDATLCGPPGAWFEAKPAPDTVYKAAALGVKT